MTQSGCEAARLSLGSYVLGALDPHDRVLVEQHLEICPACRDELSELAGLPGLLARVHVAQLVEDEPAAPPELLDRLLDSATAERRTARRWRVLAAAAFVAVLTAGATAAAVQVAEGGHHAAAPVTFVSATDPVTHVHAVISTQPKHWGTAVRVQLTGVPDEETCSLVVLSRTGQREVAASWRVDYRGDVDVEGATAWSASDIAAYEVVTLDGRHLVTVNA
jgi:anti-sigma factor RsiW